MRIAVDNGALSDGHSVRGIGVMVREQIQAIRKETLKDEALTIDGVDLEKTSLGKYDIFHYPYFFPYSPTLPAKKTNQKVIVTIQDLIQLVYPKNYPPGIRGRIDFTKQKLRLKNVDGIITISETSKKDIVRFLGVKPEKIRVIYLAPKKIFKPITNLPADKTGYQSLITTKRKYKLPERFVLYVGDVNYNKNILTLIKACKIAKLPLVICGKQALEIEEGDTDLRSLSGPQDWIRFLRGKPHPELAHYQALLSEFRNNSKIIRLGFVSDNDLVVIYNLASVYCQPSLYEGFGFPVLEAMACGIPVVISRTNALMEIAGGAALIAETENSKDIAEKITKVLKNPSTLLRTSSNTKECLRKKGFEQVKKYSWEKTAKETIQFYKQILKS